jgi:serine protease inhibitor
MLDALGLQGLSADDAASEAGVLTDRLAAGGCATVEIANSIWTRPGLSLDAGYLRTVQSSFHGEAHPLLSGSVQAINGWVSRATHGRITSIVDRVPPEVLLYLIDAIYFHADWQTPFDPQLTRRSPFRRAAGRDVAVPLMGRTGQFAYGADFSGIAPDCRDVCFISDVTQEARIAVDESGTTASAVTKGATAVSAPVMTFRMVVNRPFLAAIQDTRTGALLFAGVIGDPTAGA